MKTKIILSLFCHNRIFEIILNGKKEEIKNPETLYSRGHGGFKLMTGIGPVTSALPMNIHSFFIVLCCFLMSAQSLIFRRLLALFVSLCFSTFYIF